MYFKVIVLKPYIIIKYIPLCLSSKKALPQVNSFTLLPAVFLELLTLLAVEVK